MANMRGNIEQIVTNTKTIGGYRCGQGIDDALKDVRDLFRKRHNPEIA